MSKPSKQERIEDFLRKSLLGDQLINTQFHLFSARSYSSGRVLKPRVLCANNALLAKSSKYFLDLLGSDANPADPSLMNLTDDDDVPSDAQIEDYGYGSDSDLEDFDDPVAKPVMPTTLPDTKSRSKGHNELSEDESKLDNSDILVMTSEQSNPHVSSSLNTLGNESAVTSGAAAQQMSDEASANQTAIRLRFWGSRHVLVKDAAFQTWYALLNYLYTNKSNFLPLGSTTPDGQRRELSANSLDEPGCSAKSMYHLACKVGLDRLRDEAFSFIQSNLTEHNILKELSCSLVSRRPELLEMELDVLYCHIASPAVVADFPAFAKRIANKELPHGADIVVGIHARIPKARPLPPKLVPFAPSAVFGFPGPVKSDARKDAPVVKAEDDAGSPGVDKGRALSVPPSHPQKKRTRP